MPGPRTAAAAVIFDLDGTLVDSDAALDAAWVACGIAPEDITHGHVLAEECARLGVALEDYMAAYDPAAVVAFPGVSEMLEQVGRWAVCSNKRAEVGPLELAALGWQPEVALFADAFPGSKELGPVLTAMRLAADDVIFVGDTLHDRRAAQAVGCRFLWAGWNPRIAPVGGDEVAPEPAAVLAAAGGQLLA